MSFRVFRQALNSTYPKANRILWPTLGEASGEGIRPIFSRRRLWAAFRINGISILAFVGRQLFGRLLAINRDQSIVQKGELPLGMTTEEKVVADNSSKRLFNGFLKQVAHKIKEADCLH